MTPDVHFRRTDLGQRFRIGYVPLVRNGGLTWAGGILAVAVVLSGCSTTVTGTARPAAVGGIAAGASLDPAAPTTPPAPDAVSVQATLLQLGDLPAGWTDQGGSDVQSGDMPDLELCLGGRDTGADTYVVDASPTFGDSSGSIIFSTVAGFHSQRDVDDDAALLADPRTAGCLETSVEQGMSSDPNAAGATLGKASFTVTPGSSGGPGNVVATAVGSVPVSAPNGRHGTVYLGAVFITGRMTEAEILFMSVRPIPDSLRSAAVAAVAQRVAAL